MAKIPHTAMILAAGFGMRMRPLTLDKPKPLIEVGGVAMIDQVLERLVAAGVARAVVNLHYKGELIEKHLQGRRDIEILFSHEAEILDTGGGVKHAAKLLGNDAIYVINADLPWRDASRPALQQLAENFDAARMDGVMLFSPLVTTKGFSGAKGDFFLCEEKPGFGPAYRAATNPPRPYVFISAQIILPGLFAARPETAFSTNLIWDELEKQNRLFGLIHDGSCYHVGTPQDLADANHLLQSGVGW